MTSTNGQDKKLRISRFQDTFFLSYRMSNYVIFGTRSFLTNLSFKHYLRVHWLLRIQTFFFWTLLESNSVFNNLRISHITCNNHLTLKNSHIQYKLSVKSGTSYKNLRISTDHTENGSTNMRDFNKGQVSNCYRALMVQCLFVYEFGLRMQLHVLQK